MAKKRITKEHLHHEFPMPDWVVPIIGKKFGRLTLTSYEGRNKYIPYGECICECGVVAIYDLNHLKRGESVSCGCFRSDFTRSRLTVHGFAPLQGYRKKVYKTWQGMNARCHNPKNNHFHLYGGRGIGVCERWRSRNGGFQNFLDDMGQPEEGMSLDRIDNEKNYAPENCRWIPMRDQAKNRRYNWKVNLFGDVVSCAEAARILEIPKSYLSYILKRSKLNKCEIVTLNPELFERRDSNPVNAYSEVIAEKLGYKIL